MTRGRSHREGISGWDGFQLLAAVVGIALCLYVLFVPAPKVSSRARPTLRSSLPAPDLKAIHALARRAKPTPSQPSWRPPTMRPNWRWIVVHHSATLSGNAASFDRYHRSEERGMENGLAYHFVIGNGHGAEDGLVEVGERWRKQLAGGHVKGEEHNQTSIGICMVGNFDLAGPTEKQFASLKGLLNYLVATSGVPVSRVVVHRDMTGQSTDCPGRYLPLDVILKHRFGR